MSRTSLLAALGSLLLAVGCTSTSTSTTHSAITGDECAIDSGSYIARTGGGHGNGGHGSPTGIPGDNMDDPHSGKIDCLGDGNSGQGDDKKHPCTPDDFPQEGCDANGCCDDGVLDPDDGEEDPSDPDDGDVDEGPSDPSGGDDHGCGGGDPSGDPPDGGGSQDPDPSSDGGPTDPVL